MQAYRFLGEKICGATHIKNNKPCQDALLIESSGDTIIAAVADGHGSENCPYSDEGAEAAVAAVYEVFQNIISTDSTEQMFTTLSANKEIWLPKQIEHVWKQKIRELHNSKDPEGTFSSDIYLLYGATVLGVVVTETFIFALQLGDGDILSIDIDGGVRWLIEPDYMDGSATYSLCIKNCWEYVKTCILPLDATRQAPGMIMLCTDGYSNSFTSEAGFLKAGTDIYKLLRDEGIDYVKARLPDWLNNSSHNGSGDDITLALIFRSKE